MNLSQEVSAPVSDGEDVSTQATSGSAYRFGTFRLLPLQHRLEDNGAVVRLGSRAFDILTLLVERAGTLVSKKDLMKRAWPRTVVEEGNLKVAIASLRRALGERDAQHRYLATTPGHGYRFVAPVSRVDDVDPPADTSVRCHVPHSPLPVLGRAEAIFSVQRLLSRRRLVSIVGAGGIGKSTVAVAVAGRIAAAGEQAVSFIDMATLNDEALLPEFIATGLGLAARCAATTAPCAARAAAALQGQRRLIVLDNCEHVLSATAALVEQILAFTSDVSILTTTREPLRASGETVHRLGPLLVPPTGHGLTARGALDFPAVALFVERARASMAPFSLADEDAPVVADICGKLDGMPLAIEITATRVSAFTLRELSTLLDDHARLLGLEQRSNVPRHRSLSAVLDASFESLSSSERAVLRRLSVLDDVFTLPAACAVGDDDGDVAEALATLVAKSLVCADVGGTAGRYSLQRTVRVYAGQKLLEAGEADRMGRHRSPSSLALVQGTDMAPWPRARSGYPRVMNRSARAAWKTDLASTAKQSTGF